MSAALKIAPQSPPVGLAKLATLPPDIQKIVKAAQERMRANGTVATKIDLLDFDDDTITRYSVEAAFDELKDGDQALTDALIEAKLEWWRR